MTRGRQSADGTGITCPADVRAKLYRTMRLTRCFEEHALELVKSGEIIGGIHPCIGQEAVAAGVCGALRLDDVIMSNHRGHGHALAKGADPGRLFAELTGRATGLNAGRGGSIHPADLSMGIFPATGVVGSNAATMSGVAWAARRAGSDRVAVNFFGDGAVSQGVLLESFNLAALWRLPVLFICENNGYATTMPVHGTVAGTMTGRAAAFGIPSATIDGMDAEKVLAAAEDAVARARAGEGPTFLEYQTYRFLGHHTVEQHLRLEYRTAEEIERWRTRDPLDIEAARIPEADRERIDAEAEATIAQAVDFALSSPHPDPDHALDHLYASGLRPRAGAI